MFIALLLHLFSKKKNKSSFANEGHGQLDWLTDRRGLVFERVSFTQVSVARLQYQSCYFIYMSGIQLPRILIQRKFFEISFHSKQLKAGETRFALWEENCHTCQYRKKIKGFRSRFTGVIVYKKCKLALRITLTRWNHSTYYGMKL